MFTRRDPRNIELTACGQSALPSFWKVAVTKLWTTRWSTLWIRMGILCGEVITTYHHKVIPCETSDLLLQIHILVDNNTQSTGVKKMIINLIN